MARNPYASGDTIGQILDAYEKAGFPNRYRSARTDRDREGEKRNAERLRRILGPTQASQFSAMVCDRFADLRRRELAEAGREGSRTVDVELQTLSNAFNYAVRAGIALTNPVRLSRPRYRRTSEARHARDCMPTSGTELHRLAFALADDSRGEVLAWQALFLALTGCRTSEILELRIDASSGQPGCIEGDWLWVKRRKRGVNPYVLLTPELRECIAAHRAWLERKHPGSPFWFPGVREGVLVVEPTSLVKALQRVSKALGLGDRTGHGLRAFYVTVRRAAGASDGQVAAEIGDTSVALISTTYGQVPPNWRGGPELSWRPLEGKAFWDPQ